MQTTDSLTDRQMYEGKGQLLGFLNASSEPHQAYQAHLRAVRTRSEGLAHRIAGIKTARTHDLLSRLEYHAFLMFEFSVNITNIREQFPIPLALTLALAKSLGVKHPYNWRERKVAQMSADFVLTLKEGEWLAVDVKPEGKLNRDRVREKLKLTKEAFACVGVTHKIVTESDLPAVAINNYRVLHPLALRFDEPPLPGTELERGTAALIAQLKSGKTTIRDAANRVHAETRSGVGHLIRTAMWQIARRHWQVDLTRPIGPDQPLCFLS